MTARPGLHAPVEFRLSDPGKCIVVPRHCGRVVVSAPSGRKMPRSKGPAILRPEGADTTKPRASRGLRPNDTLGTISLPTRAPRRACNKYLPTSAIREIRQESVPSLWSRRLVLRRLLCPFRAPGSFWGNVTQGFARTESTRSPGLSCVGPFGALARKCDVPYVRTSDHGASRKSSEAPVSYSAGSWSLVK